MEEKLNTNILEIEELNIDIPNEEINDDYVNDDLYNINSWGADYSFRELTLMYKDGDLEKPELQRKYVWKKTEASRFIDSILLGLPIPSIFLAKTKENKLLIIDGYQRLMTVYDYIRGIWSGDGKSFKLSNVPSKINERWINKEFSELSDSEQRKIKTATIHAIIFEQKSPKDGDTSLYQIFERINTSGRSLFPQEIRNCVYQGKMNSLLFELNTNENWRNLFGNEQEDERMRDLEYILRFFALNTDYIIKENTRSSISLKKYLNEFMGNEQNNTGEKISKFREDFTNTVEHIYNYIGANAFFNIQSNDLATIRKRFYPPIFDAIMIATYIAKVKGLNINMASEDKRLELLKDDDFRKYISEGTMQLGHIRGRVKLALKYLYNYEQ